MVEEIKGLIMLKESMMIQIHDARVKIANLKQDKINIRAKAWENAEGIADAKKDYVRSVVSDLDYEISILEADIELYYNQIKILDEKVELEYLKDE